MTKNKKIIALTAIFACSLCVSSMAANYVFVKSDSESADGNVDVKDRKYYDILLKAGYANASCTVRDSGGNNVSQTDIQNFFIATNDDGTSALDVTDSYGNHFVKLNKYYINMSQDSDGVITYKLSRTKVDDTYFVCPYFKNKDGNEIDYAYYGKYKGYVSGSKLCSKAGVTPTYSITIDNFRAYARNNSNQYHQTDWCAVFTVQIMLMCYYKTTKVDDTITYRYFGDTTGSGVQVLGIEDIIGNGYEDVDGVIFRSGSSLAASSVSWAEKISDYASGITTNRTTLTGASGTSGNYISRMYYASGKPALSIFPKALSGSSSTYYCDEFLYNSSYSPNLTYWGALGSDDYLGLFYLYCYDAWSSAYSGIGSRLHAKVLV